MMQVKKYGQKFIHSLFLNILILASAHGQELRQDYAMAKEQFRVGNYDRASRLFTSIAETSGQNPYRNYALFYKGMIEFKQGNFTAARQVFANLDNSAPGWEKRDDNLYMLALTEFELEKFPAGFSLSDRIRNTAVKADIWKAEAHYLKNVESEKQLEELYRSFPDNPRIAQAYVKILAKTGKQEDLIRANAIIDRFNFSRESIQTSIRTAPSKDEYNIALILPQSLHLVTSGGTVRNSIFLDYLKGFRLGLDYWAAQGMKINLFVYDNQSPSFASQEELLSKPEIKGMDLLIYQQNQSSLSLANRLSLETQNPLIIPIQGDVEGLEPNPLLLMAKPSAQTIAATGVKYARLNFENRSVAIIYSNSARDESLAQAYKKAAEAAGFRVVAMDQISGPEGGRIFEQISSASGNYRSVGHVFVATENSSVVSNLLSSVIRRGDRLPIIGFDTWLGITNVNPNQLESLGVNLLGFNSFSYASALSQSFRDQYIQKHSGFPAAYSYYGYDLALMIGYGLKNHSTNFPDAFRNGAPINFEFISGMSFGKGPDNQHLPIYRVSEGKLVKIDF